MQAAFSDLCRQGVLGQTASLTFPPLQAWKGEETAILSVATKHCKQDFQFNLIVELQNIICTARFPSTTGSLSGLRRSHTKGQKDPFCSPPQAIPSPATQTRFYAAPVQRYLHEFTWGCNNTEVS